jgi:hypothetical protein
VKDIVLATLALAAIMRVDGNYYMWLQMVEKIPCTTELVLQDHLLEMLGALSMSSTMITP